MVNTHGTVAAAKRLIGGESLAFDALTRLYMEQRLDLTVEATVLRPEFASLFTAAERARARQILASYPYRPLWDHDPVAP